MECGQISGSDAEYYRETGKGMRRLQRRCRGKRMEERNAQQQSGRLWIETETTREKAEKN